jgi:hypothetical protein
MRFLKSTALTAIMLTVGGPAVANELFSTPPTEYVVSGKDRDGNDAYEIRAIVEQDKGTTRLRELTVKIYDDSISVAAGVLKQVLDPDFGDIKVVNDAGVFGSYLYIDIPFGE